MKQERLNKQSKVNRLDLGLSSILSSFGDVPAATAESAAPAASPPTSGEPNFILISPLGAPVAPVPPHKEEAPRQANEFEVLAGEERWLDLAHLCESKLSATADVCAADPKKVIEARLWWIKSQLVNGGVPMSILAAPLESVSGSVLEMQKSGQNLGERERALVAFCAELLKKVSAELTASSEHVLALSFLERAHALDERCAPQFRSAIDRELERLRKNPRAEMDQKLKSKIARLEDLRRQLKGVKPEEIKAAPVSAPESVKAEEVPAALPARQSRRQLYAAAALILLVASGAGIWFMPQGTFVAGTPHLALGTLSTSRPPPDTKLGELQRVSGLSNLDALYYDIDSASKRRPAESGSASTKSEQPALAASEAASTSPKERDAKAIVNTSGPLEGPEFQNLQMEDAENDGTRRDDLFASITARSMAATQGVPVEKFESDKLFLVIAKTNVMARPSFHTAALAELESGDKVLVESKVGPWLKLRSKHGQAGYILAQDAELSSKRPTD